MAGEIRGADPLSDDEFAQCMERIGPFERRPLLAVAVSGGADSLTLCLLAARWAAARQGKITALTVDHHLRPDSTDEAVQVGRWLGARRLDHHVLDWTGPYPTGNRQAEARAARYGLLERWCAAAGCLHLLVAHHREDQAETFWLRLARGSGVDGLAAMPAVAERAGCRILRPLLDVPPERLAARLTADGQSWISDPSNRNTGYARIRLREARALLAAEGLGGNRLTETTRHLGLARAALEAQQTRLLVNAVRLHTAGFAWLDARQLGAAPREIGLRVLASVLVTIGSGAYPPRLERLDRLFQKLVTGSLGAGRTLAGCRILNRRGGVLICRESEALAPDVPLVPGCSVTWDRRFSIALPETAPDGLSAAALRRDYPPADIPFRTVLERLPAPVRPSLLSLRDRRGLAAVPALGWTRPDRADLWQYDKLCDAVNMGFRPARSLAPLGFTVV